MQNVSVYLWIALALACANLPFLNRRLFVLIPHQGKSRHRLPWQLLELAVLYLAVLGLGLLLEKNAGQIYPQGWAFYATTMVLFMTFAFPGFVACHLLRGGK